MKIKRFLSLFLILALFCAVLPVSAAEPPLLSGTVTAPSFLSAPPVSQNAELVRRRLVSAARQLRETVDVSELAIPATEAGFAALQAFVFNDTPELCNIARTFNYYTDGETMQSIRLTYVCSAEESEQRYAAFFREADALLDGIRGSSLSEVEKALLLHDRLAVHVAYDEENLENNTLPEESFTAYGAIALRTAVCQGYAAAYLYLLREAGISSEICSSQSLQHAWNIVYIGGVPYHVDVTWDDPVDDLVGRARHRHFLLSTATMLSRHGMTQADHSTAPVDTTYEAYAWTTSETQIVLIDGVLYYLDAQDSTLNVLDAAHGVSSGVVTALPGEWETPDEGYYWIGSYASLDTDGTSILYSTPQEVRAYDLETGDDRSLAQAELGGVRGRAVFGFALDRENEKLVCEIRNEPDSIAEREYQYFPYSLPKAPAASLALSLLSRADGSFGAFAALYPAGMTDEQILADAAGALALYTAVPGDASAADGLFAQPVSFPEVAPGAYRLLLTKAGKHAPRILSVTLGESDADLGGIALWLYGDVNNDGAVNARDALQISRYAAGKASVLEAGNDADLTAYRLRVADVNRDGDANSRDALQISRCAAGKSSQLDLLP